MRQLITYFQKKVLNHIHSMINKFPPEIVYKNMLYINSLIKKHTPDNKLLLRLKQPNTNVHFFYLRLI